MGEGSAPGAALDRRKGPVEPTWSLAHLSKRNQVPQEQGGQERGPRDAEPSLLQIQNRKLEVLKITL